MSSRLKGFMHAYSDDVLARLRAEDVPRLPGRVVPITPGTLPAFDDCCDGLLYGRIESMIPVIQNGPGAPAGLPCSVSFWTVTAAVGLVRCAASVDSKGRAPSALAVLSDGHEMVDDMRVIEAAVLSSPHTRSVNGWVPLEVEGGCHGGEWSFTMRLGTADLTSPAP